MAQKTNPSQAPRWLCTPSYVNHRLMHSDMSQGVMKETNVNSLNTQQDSHMHDSDCSHQWNLIEPDEVQLELNDEWRKRFAATIKRKRKSRKEYFKSMNKR